MHARTKVRITLLKHHLSHLFKNSFEWMFPHYEPAVASDESSNYSTLVK